MEPNTIAAVVHETLDLYNARQAREFSVPPSTHIGPGALARCGEAAADMGITRLFILFDATLHRMGTGPSLFRSLLAAGVEHELYIYEGGEPNSDTVYAAVEKIAQAGCDGVLAFGGGSVLDAGKAAVLLASNPGSKVADLGCKSPRLKRKIPFICVPTTAGTGSEATDVSVITDSQQHLKQVVMNHGFLPDLAIIDACLTLDVPPHITAATGVDALTHAIEAYVAQGVTPLTRGLAYRAITLIGEALPLAVGQGQNIEARESMMLASTMAGMAFSNAGLGLCHAMAHPLGATCKVPHGLANAMLLPSVMRFNKLVCKKEFPEIGHALTGQILDAEGAIQAVQGLILDVGLTATLQSVGSKPEDFDLLADEAMNDFCLPGNPRSTSKKQIVGVFMDAWKVGLTRQA